MAFKKVENEAITIGTEETDTPQVVGHFIGFRVIDGGHGQRPQPLLSINGAVPKLVFCGADAVQKLMPLHPGTLVRITAEKDKEGKHLRREISNGRTMKSYVVEADTDQTIPVPPEWATGSES